MFTANNEAMEASAAASVSPERQSEGVLLTAGRSRVPLRYYYWQLLTTRSEFSSKFDDILTAMENVRKDIKDCSERVTQAERSISTTEDDVTVPQEKVTGQTKSGSQAHHEKKNIKDRYVARIGVTGAPPWSQAWSWGAWWPGLCPRDPARAQPEMAMSGPPSSRLTTRRKVHEGPVQCGLGSSRGRGPRRPNPWTKTLAIGTWNVTSLGGGEGA
ncbi:hypothetical protein L3Q82_026821 [Scortum barcoo]|uniref:Uncharacterized protein n=1 Tax=Scortum barcoo TaxID=214431 RepID=A0ACB8WJW5_9TELE|nr:hypothetical protein L3Q82_026821 [Scortum barcoo]